MKKFTLVSLISLLCISQLLAQTTHIANNRPGAPTGTNVFTGSTALQDAIDAAVSGDVIQIVPSSINYGNVNITDKALTLIGIGLDPDTQIGQRSLVDDITFDEVGASGSRISGLNFDRLILANTVGGYTLSNILLENSQLDVVIGPGRTENALGNITIRNCVLNSSNSTSDAQAFELYTTSGVIIENNIIQGQCRTAGTIQGDGLTIRNNLFYDGLANGIAFHHIDNSTVQNNIFLNTNPAVGSNSTGNTFLNNISFNTTADAFTIGLYENTGSGNIESTDPMLTDVPLVPGGEPNWNFSNDLTPATGSPVLNAGTDGTDIGPTGGANPIDLEGTFLPIIQALTLPSIVSQGTDLEINIKAKGN